MFFIIAIVLQSTGVDISTYITIALLLVAGWATARTIQIWALSRNSPLPRLKAKELFYDIVLAVGLWIAFGVVLAMKQLLN